MNQNQFIEGYRIIRVIQENIRMRQLRVLKEPGSDRFILKLNSLKYPTQNELEELGFEYSVLKDLDLDGVLKVLELKKIGLLTVLCFEDFEGILLSEYIQKQPIGTGLFLNIAVTLCRILLNLHCKGMVHGDISPDNILIAPEFHNLRLMNFHFAFKSTDKQSNVHRSRDLERNLAYISPEQTLRVKHAPGIRSDLYSLGVVFYEMLTGKHPFPFQDPMELVYAHLAFKPVYPHELNQGIPPVVSKLIMKLIAKSPEERYQTAASLLEDLEKCSQQLAATGTVEDFTLAQSDIYEHLRITQKLYGREKEVETMVNAFHEASLGHPQIIMVSGPPGIGKSFLIEQFLKYAVQINGFFISGKFDQYKNNIPYHAVIEAFQKMLKIILTKPSAKFDEWKTAIQTALGPNGSLITKLLPELEIIIGKQPEVPQLGSLESLNRFQYTFRNFMRVFACFDHPLVLFIDDCQWADSASLELIKTLLTDPEMKCFMFIGAHRDEEFNANPHCLAILQEVKNESTYQIQALELQPLAIESLEKWVTEMLPSSSFELLHFSRLVMEKSQGNPFFVIQFLQSLYDHHILLFDRSSASWYLNWIAAQTTLFSDNIADLIISRLNHLSPATRYILQMAASLGNIFDLRALMLVTEMNEIALLEHLQEAIENHFIIFFESLLQNNRLSSSELPANPRFKFLHDRIQQAAYHLVDDKTRKHQHFKIAHLLLNRFNAGESEEHLFDMIEHFNQCIDLIEDFTERLTLARLFLLAGRKAKRSAAYQLAFDHFNTGLQMLDKDSWRSEYPLTLSLFTETVEAAYICGRFELVDTLAQVILQHTIEILDRIRIYEIMIHTFIAQHKFKLAIKIGLDVLRMLGINLPDNPNKLYLFLRYINIRCHLIGRSYRKLLEHAAMTDPKQLAIMRIISTIGSVIYWSSPDLLPAIIFQNLISSIRYGNSPESAYAYAGYGLILCSLGHIDAGYRYGELALELTEKYHRETQHIRAKFVINTYLLHCKKHLRETLEPLYSLYRQCMEAGENEFAAWSLMAYSGYFLWSGYPLKLVKDKFLSNLDIIKLLKQEAAYNLSALSYQGVLNLLGANENPVVLKGEAFDEETMLPLIRYAKNRFILGSYYIEKMFLCYLFEKFDLALNMAQKAEEYLDSLKGTVRYAVFYTYDSLIRLALYEKFSAKHRFGIRKQIRANQKKIKLWAEYAPMNYLHRYYLVEAEYKRVLGADGKAVSCYEQAIKLANQNDYIYESALANELTAKFYLSRKLPKIAATYLMDAYYFYDLWGAQAKTKQLENKYRQIFLNMESFQKCFSARISEISKNNFPIMDSIGSRIDVLALLRASHAIADEILIDKLLIKLIDLLMENAGAEKVVLILKSGDQFYFEAEGFAAENRITVLQGIPIQQIDSLPKSIIRYVIRKREILVLDHAQKDELFMDDPYVHNRDIKSVLCMPLIYQNELTAVLYLENNLNTGVFSAERQRVLEILGSQAAISLKNALILRDFHNELEERKKTQKELDQYKDKLTKLVEERTAELRTTNMELEREILEKTRMEKQIKASLKEKEMLLQEIHHRVKNNMQIISSLLNLQSRYIQDSKALEMFKESRDRVQSMALIHEILYLSADLARINLEKYISNLATNLYHSYGVDPNKIRLEIKIEKVLLGIDLAIPCGLIINELVSNALKYAFPATQYGSAMIQISLHPLDHNEVELIVQDNGIGIHSQANLHRENTLGLKLVSILTEEQLHGSLNVKDSQGTLFTIRFPL